jgi:hypothetical protein
MPTRHGIARLKSVFNFEQLSPGSIDSFFQAKRGSAPVNSAWRGIACTTRLGIYRRTPASSLLRIGSAATVEQTGG